MNDQQIEKEIVEKGKTAPRVTPQYIESIILEEHFFTAYDGIRAANMGVLAMRGQRINLQTSLLSAYWC